MQHLISTDRTTKNIASEALTGADEKVGYNDWEEPYTPPSQSLE
jgi:hypothetical protein